MHHAAQHAATMQGRYVVACVLKLVIVVVVRIEYSWKFLYLSVTYRILGCDFPYLLEIRDFQR